MAEFFEAGVAESGNPQAFANLILNEPDRVPDLEPVPTAKLVRLIGEKKVTPQNGRVVLERMARDGGRDPEQIIEAEGLGAMEGGDELDAIVDAALAANADAAEKIRAGNMKAIGPIIGHVMRETKGRADGGEVTRLVRAKLGL